MIYAKKVIKLEEITWVKFKESFVKLLSLVFVFVITSCSTTVKDSDFIYKNGDSEIEASRDKVLTDHQVKTEVEMLKYALRKAYSGYYFKNKEAVDFGITQLESIKSPISIYNFCTAITKSFSKVRDRHLGFKLGWSRCPSSKRVAGVGKRLYSDKKKTWTVDFVKKKKRNILIVTISRFPSSSSPKWDGLLDKVKKWLPRSEAIFLDMRGNGGGDDGMGYELAKILTGEDSIPNGYGVQYKVTSDIGLLTRWNYFKRLTEVVENEKQKAFFKEYVATDKEKYWQRGRNIVSSEDELAPIRLVKAKKPIYILQDTNCASSCESTIDFFEYVKPMKRVGENTGGFIHFGNLGFFILPYSRMRVEIASTYNEYRDGRFVEVSGISPHIKVPVGGDAFEAAFTDFISEK